jgi:hypothetical protein
MSLASRHSSPVQRQQVAATCFQGQERGRSASLQAGNGGLCEVQIHTSITFGVASLALDVLN